MKSDKFILIQDRILVRKLNAEELDEIGGNIQGVIIGHNQSLLYVGRVEKVGPGYINHSNSERPESWKNSDETTSYIPTQVKPNDVVVFNPMETCHIKAWEKDYYIFNQSGCLLIIRD